MQTDIQIIQGDALEALPKMRNIDAIVTSLPDRNEIDMSIGEYRHWFRRAVESCFAAVPPDGIVIFYQTDRKEDGQWFSKSSAIIEHGHRLLWHKIVLRHISSAVDLYRPGYSHLMAFSERGKTGKASADVMDAGRFLWRYGMGLAATRFAVNYARRFGPTICDPFCGQGTVLSVADGVFDRAIGIDIDPECCSIAQNRIAELAFPTTTKD